MTDVFNPDDEFVDVEPGTEAEETEEPEQTRSEDEEEQVPIPELNAQPVRQPIVVAPDVAPVVYDATTGEEVKSDEESDTEEE